MHTFANAAGSFERMICFPSPTCTPSESASFCRIWRLLKDLYIPKNVPTIKPAAKTCIDQP